MFNEYNKHTRIRTESRVVEEIAKLQPDVIKKLIGMVHNLEDVHQAEIMTEPASTKNKLDIDERIANSMLTALRQAYIKQRTSQDC